MTNLFGSPFDRLIPQLDPTRMAMAKRAQCAETGHLYQITGKSHPTKLACKRCSVTWAIGPRTEPTTL